MRSQNNLETYKFLARLLKKIEHDAQLVGLSSMDIQQLKKDCTKVFYRKHPNLFPFDTLTEK